jgi:hypothetical protein
VGARDDRLVWRSQRPTWREHTPQRIGARLRLRACAGSARSSGAGDPAYVLQLAFDTARIVRQFLAASVLIF